jgi:mono/diheme cytochrome c family protein
MKWTPIALSLSLVLPALAWADTAEEIWQAKCKGCHGATGKGDTKVGEKEKIHDLTTEKFQKNHSDDDIRTVITEGSTDNPKMKPFKDKLTPEEIDGLVKHIRTLGKKK